jgi:hypothetical protein
MIRAAYDFCGASAEGIWEVSVEARSIDATVFVWVAFTVLVDSPVIVIVRTAFCSWIALAMMVVKVGVIWAAFIFRIAHAELVGRVVIAWAALVAALALAEIGVSAPGIEEWEIWTAVSLRVARAERIVQVIITQVRAALNVTYARTSLVFWPGFSNAAEIIAFSSGAVIISASVVSWAAVESWVASAILRVGKMVVSQVLAAGNATVAIAKLVILPRVKRTALSFVTSANAGIAEGWICSPCVLGAAFFRALARFTESWIVSPVFAFAASNIWRAWAVLGVSQEIVALVFAAEEFAITVAE